MWMEEDWNNDDTWYQTAVYEIEKLSLDKFGGLFHLQLNLDLAFIRHSIYTASERHIYF